MSGTGFERRVRRELQAAQPPRAGEAERRAWEMVRAAHAARVPIRARHRGRRLALAAAAVLAVGAFALSPAGAKVGHWIGDVVAPTPTRPALSFLPARGRLLVVADAGAWIVQHDGARRQLGSFRDATWSPGGLYVAAARGNELVAVDPYGNEHWARPAARRVTTPRWSPDGFRIAYRSGSDLYVVRGDNGENWLLARHTLRAPPAWKPLAAPAEQVVAFAAGGRVRIVEVDSGRPLGATPPGPAPREIWWAEDGRRLVTVTARSIRVHGPRGRLLRTIRLPRGLRAAGSAMAPRGRRLAVIGRRAHGPSNELLLLRLDRAAGPRSLLSMPARFEGVAWSIDGSVLVLGLPEADQWLYLRPRRSVGFGSVGRIRKSFAGGQEPRTGAFPRPAGWCWAERANRTASGQPACSSGSAP